MRKIEVTSHWCARCQTLESDVTGLSHRVLPCVVAVMNASHPAEEEQTFFEKERERLSNEIARVSSYFIAEIWGIVDTYAGFRRTHFIHKYAESETRRCGWNEEGN